MSKNRTSLAIITGASSGIGRATALQLTQDGYDLLLMARRQERLNELKSEILQKTPHAKVMLFAGDIRSRQDLNRLVETHRVHFKNLSVIVNNAGLAKGVESFQESKLEDWDAMIDTNVKGVLCLTRLLIPFMIEQKQGHIINLGSVAGRWVYPGGAVY